MFVYVLPPLLPHTKRKKGFIFQKGTKKNRKKEKPIVNGKKSPTQRENRSEGGFGGEKHTHLSPCCTYQSNPLPFPHTHTHTKQGGTLHSRERKHTSFTFYICITKKKTSPKNKKGRGKKKNLCQKNQTEGSPLLCSLFLSLFLWSSSLFCPCRVPFFSPFAIQIKNLNQSHST